LRFHSRSAYDFDAVPGVGTLNYKKAGTMSLTVNGINVNQAILTLEFQVAELQALLNWMFKNGTSGPDDQALQDVRAKAMEAVRSKYPGIEFT